MSEGCLFCGIVAGDIDADVVHVTEGWTSREAHAENFASARAQAFVAKLAPLVGGEARYEDEVPVGGFFHDGATR